MSDEEHSASEHSSPLCTTPLSSPYNDSVEEQLYGAQPFLFEPEVTDSNSGSSSDSDDPDSPAESNRLGNSNW